MDRVGRNDPCPCKSGKKYKHCCLANNNKVTPRQDGEPAQQDRARQGHPIDRRREARIIQTLQAGIERHQRGSLADASAAYRRVLDEAPDHPEALHLLGVVAYQQGNLAAAIDLIGRAIERDASIPEYYGNLGHVLRAQGGLAAANGCYRAALRLKPDDAEMCKNLGQVLQLQGDMPGAAESYRAALQLDPGDAATHNNLGNVLRAQGDLVGAAESYRAVLRLQPSHAGAYNNIGVVLREQGNAAGAIASFREALRLASGHAETHNNLGTALQDQGDLAGAIARFREALRINPRFPEAYNNLGNALSAQGEYNAAIASYQEALRLGGTQAEVYNNLGNALRDQGDPVAAEQRYREAIRLKPGYAEAHNNLGIAVQAQGNPQAAAACFKLVLQLNPGHAQAHNNLGTALQEMGASAPAEESFRTATRLKPDYAVAHNNLGNLLREQGRHEEALASYRMALSYDPGYADARNGVAFELQRMCAWDGLEEMFAQVTASVRRASEPSVPPFFYMTVIDSPQDQLLCARTWAAARSASLAPVRSRLGFRHHPAPKGVLRVGYLSADFRDHATAHLIAEVFERHDRSRVEAVGYALGGDDGSAMRARVVRAFDRFSDLGALPVAEAARQIYEDGIDVLVDLHGFTRGARPGILALRPAPIQVNYLGFPCTMGADYMDYIITDRFLTPPDQQRYFSERFAYLPDSYQPNDRQRAIAARMPTRAECGLPDDGFVFCSFNNAYKITPQVFDVWMRLLHTTPGSVLWLLATHERAVENLRHEAQARGVAPERLVFAPWATPADNLARQQLADLFLDTLPVNAHTTASDALWAGLPVLTCAGQSLVSRVAGSLLHAVGLPELVTHSLEEYERTALRLARAPGELAELRIRLRAGRDTAPLWDSARYTRHLEDAYHAMWAQLVAGTGPVAIPVSGQGEWPTLAVPA